MVGQRCFKKHKLSKGFYLFNYFCNFCLTWFVSFALGRWIFSLFFFFFRNILLAKLDKTVCYDVEM